LTGQVDRIDVHFHVVPPAFAEAMRRGVFSEAVSIAGTGAAERMVFHAPEEVAVEPETELEPCQYDAKLILQALDKRELDAAAISPPPELFLYWTRPDIAERIAIAMNDGMAELARAHPDRFLPLATLPLQDCARAMRELERAVTVLGLRGAALCTHVNGRDLDAAEVEPVFALAERLDIPLFLHPQNSGTLGRLAQYHAWNMVGFPYETALAATRLVMSGLFERLPRLKVILAHGGGFFPYQIGRLDHGWRVRPDLHNSLKQAPSAYLANIFCDSLIHSDLSLRFLLDRVGTDHVVLGCDYPFSMGTDAPVDAVRQLGLPAAQQKAVLGATLGKLLKLT
jgi:aminocarboxymuconate-semialdehyde decarboxylase